MRSHQVYELLSMMQLTLSHQLRHTMDTCINLNFTDIIYSSYKCSENIPGSCEVHYSDVEDFCESNYAACDWTPTFNQSELLDEPLKCININYFKKKFILHLISTILFLGICINLFTLIAIPYVRWKYDSEFSILQSPSLVLVLHLSLCNILYCIIGFPHFYQSVKLGYFPLRRPFCFWIALIRNFLAQMSFATQGKP